MTTLDALVAAVDPERMAATVAALAGPEFAGRRAGSAGRLGCAGVAGGPVQ